MYKLYKCIHLYLRIRMYVSRYVMYVYKRIYMYLYIRMYVDYREWFVVWEKKKGGAEEEVDSDSFKDGASAGALCFNNLFQ